MVVEWVSVLMSLQLRPRHLGFENREDVEDAGLCLFVNFVPNAFKVSIFLQSEM